MSDFLGPKPLTVAGLDTAAAGKINTPGSAMATALSATILDKITEDVEDPSGIIPATFLAFGDDDIDGNPTIKTTGRDVTIVTTDAVEVLIDDAAAKPPATAALLPTQPQKTMVTTFQTGHGFTVTGTAGDVVDLNHTGEFKMGSQCVKITTNGTGGLERLIRYGGSAIDLTGKQLAMLVKVTNVTKLVNLRFQVGTGGAGAVYWRIEANSFASPNPFPEEGKWTWITLPWQPVATAGSPNRAAITDLRIDIADDNTGTPVTVHVQAIATVPQPTVKWPKGCVTFTFDDAFREQYTVALPKLASKGWAADLYIVCEAVDDADADPLNAPGLSRMTTAMVQEMQNTFGWLVGAHSDTWAHHTSAQWQDPVEARKNVIASRKWMSDRALTGYDFFAYPGGAHGNGGADLARRYFAHARTVLETGRETLPASDPIKTKPYNVTAARTLATVKAEVDAAYANGWWLVLLFHGLKASPTSVDWGITDFNDLVDYIATTYADMPVLSTAQVLERGRS